MSDLSRHLSLLAEPIRVRLLAVLQDEELQVGELVRILQLPQSTVSRHLKALREAGWVSSRSQGPASLLKANREGVDDAATQVASVVLAAHRVSVQHKEDEARLAAVLADRVMDSRTFFGKLHGRWDALRDQLYGEEFWLPTLLALLPPGLVLADLGCGTGQAVAWMAPTAARVIGVDREPAMIQAAKKRCAGLDGVELHQAELDELPVEDDVVNAAIAVLVLQHLEEPAAMLGEAGRILQAGGRLVVVDVVKHDRQAWADSMGHWHLGFSASDMASLAERSGLELASYRELPLARDATGPALFVGVLQAC